MNIVPTMLICLSQSECTNSHHLLDPEEGLGVKIHGSTRDCAQDLLIQILYPRSTRLLVQIFLP